MNDVLIGLHDRFWNELAKDVGYDDFYSSVKQKQEIVFDILSRNLRVYPTLRDAMANSFEQFEQAKEGPLPNRLSEVINPEYYSYNQSDNPRIGFVELLLPSGYQVIYKIDPNYEVRLNEYGIYDIYIVSPNGAVCNPVELVHNTYKDIGGEVYTSRPQFFFAPSKVEAFGEDDTRIVMGDLLKLGEVLGIKSKFITPSPILHEVGHFYIDKLMEQNKFADERKSYFGNMSKVHLRAFLSGSGCNYIFRNVVARIGLVRGRLIHSLNKIVIGILRQEYLADFFAVSCLGIMNQEKIDYSRPLESDHFIHMTYMELCRALHEGYEMITS